VVVETPQEVFVEGKRVDEKLDTHFSEMELVLSTLVEHTVLVNAVLSQDS